MLRQAKKSDINKLAEIHFLELHSDFLPGLGQEFLRLLYLNLLQSKNTHIWVCELDNNVQGFVVGSKNFSNDFKKIVLKNFIRFVILISPQIIKSPNILKNILETFLYAKKQGHDLIEAELIVIAVSTKFHRKGIGKKLIFMLEKSFMKDNVEKYKVIVNKNNSKANLLYNSIGFKKQREFLLYGKKLNLYIKEIK